MSSTSRGALCAVLATPLLIATLAATSGCANVVSVAPISIVAKDLNGADATFVTDVTRIETAGGCEYRLELNQPGSDRYIYEITSDISARQRKQVSPCPTDAAGAPSFDATSMSNPEWFSQQSVYYWTKKAHDYAKLRFWIRTDGWQGPDFELANGPIRPDVLGPGFGLACEPGNPPACMRVWPGTDPQVHFQISSATPETIVHEYGHYAVGYVFGHQDTSTPGGFDFFRCIHLGFQEGIADSFKVLFIHQARHDIAGMPVAVPTYVRGLNSKFINECPRDEHDLAVALSEAFDQAVWGQGMDVFGNPIDVPWPDAATANSWMANALADALSRSPDFRTHRLALMVIQHLENPANNRPVSITQPVRAIFASHNLLPAPSTASCVENDQCESNYCDSGERTGNTSMCLAARGTGLKLDACSRDDQCASNYCEGSGTDTRGRSLIGQCQIRAAIGEACLHNSHCASRNCDRGPGTAGSDRCMPSRATGQPDSLCTHDTQCVIGRCAGMALDALGKQQPGRCSTQAVLGTVCQKNQDCLSGTCASGDEPGQPRRCVSSDGSGRLGESCTGNSQCESDFCALPGTDINGVRNPGRCAMNSGLGKICTSHGDCRSGYCDSGPNTGGTNLCMPRGREGLIGDRCTHETQCASGHCADLISNSNGLLPGSCAVALAVGEMCTNNDHCASRNCDRGDRTGNTNRCMPSLGRGLPAEMCSRDNQCATSHCAGVHRNAANEWQPGQCVNKAPVSFSCTANEQCVSGWCDQGWSTGNTNLCMHPPGTAANGQACTQPSQCASNLCTATRDSYNRLQPGLCFGPKPLIFSCSGNHECQSTYCDAGPNTGNTNRCMPRGGEGLMNDPCSDDTQCASRQCSGLMKNGSEILAIGNCL